MTGLVLELQQDACDVQIPVSNLLRKALAVSKKLAITDIEEWIRNELDGYGQKEVPPYRRLVGTLKMRNPFHGWQPVFLPTELQELAHSNLNNAIGQIEGLRQDNENGSFTIRFPGDVAMAIMQLVGQDMEPALYFSTSLLDNIVESIRNTVLDFALTLEARGVLGNNMTFSKDEKAAATNTSYTINNHIGAMHGSQIQQASNGASQQFSQGLDLKTLSDVIDALSKNVNDIGLDSALANELRVDIEAIKNQLTLEKPKTGLIKLCLESVKTILEGAGNMIAAQYLPLITPLLAAITN